MFDHAAATEIKERVRLPEYCSYAALQVDDAWISTIHLYVQQNLEDS